MNLANQPAFPRPGIHTGTRNRHGEAVIEDAEPGMTYRQWLVGMALQGLLARSPNMPGAGTVGSDAVIFADAAIRAQEKS